MNLKKLTRLCMDKRFTYRALPRFPGQMLGIGTYPKYLKRHDTSAPYYKPLCKQEEYSGVYILQGSGVYQDELGNKCTLAAGDFFHRLPGVHHTARPDFNTQWLEIFICLPATIWDNWLACLPPLPELTRKWKIGIRADLIRQLLTLQDELESRSESGLCSISLQIQNLLLEFFQLSSQQQSNESDIISVARERLKNDYSREIDLTQFAQQLGLGYETFRRKFLAETGISPGAYRNNMRIEKACQLLRTRELSISEVAVKLGYSDGFVFSRQFKKATGKSPSAFARESM